MCAEQIKQKDMIIVAMKGHPGSGKSTLATSIATALQIPLLDKDDVRDSTLSLQRSLLLLLSTSPPAAASSLLNDLSYHAIWQIASTQLRLGLSVVVDSPLSRRTHLDLLLELASARGARVLVVECKPADQAEWRRRLELRGRAAAPGTGGGWHKPATWSDVERLLEGYGGCTDYDVGDVPRLVVDTTARVDAQELVSGVLEFICSHCGPSSQPTPQ